MITVPTRGRPDSSNNKIRRHRFAAFRRDERGTVVIVSAIVLPLLLLVVGFGIDYSNALRARTAIASALDAALLAAARDLSIGSIDEDDVNKQVNAYFTANVLGANLGSVALGRVSTNLDKDTGTVSGTIAADVKTAFSGILNTDSIGIGSDGAASYNLLNVELSLVLDITGSMDGAKLSDLKTAASDLIDALLPDSKQTGGIDKVRLSVVPYSDLVNVGAYERAITGYSSGESCVHERAGTNATTDVAPVGPVKGFGADDDGIVNVGPGTSGNSSAKAIVNDARNFRGYDCDIPSITPLTGNKSKLKSRIANLEAGGWTAGHLGIQWGWYTLSPRFNAVWPAESDAKSYGAKDNLKVLVVMTDGSFNTWYEDGIGDSYDQGRALCSNIKDNDVLLYTVAFRAPPDAEAFLRSCADGPDYYFETSTGSALRKAFEEIAQRLRALRLSS